MRKEVAQPTLDTRELDVIQFLYGVGTPAPSQDSAPLEPRMSAAEVKRIEEQALRKLRNLRLEHLAQFRQAG